MVISNGGFNLFVDKQAGVDAAFHCTKPGGRFLLTDVVIDEAAAAQAEAEADCAAPS